MTTDFGFYFEEDHSESITQLESTKISAQEAAKHLYDRINILLTKLESDPDKPTIKWPDRVAQIGKFRKELLKILKEANID